MIISAPFPFIRQVKRIWIYVIYRRQLQDKVSDTLKVKKDTPAKY